MAQSFILLCLGLGVFLTPSEYLNINDLPRRQDEEEYPPSLRMSSPNDSPVIMRAISEKDESGSPDELSDYQSGIVSNITNLMTLTLGGSNLARNETTAAMEEYSIQLDQVLEDPARPKRPQLKKLLKNPVWLTVTFSISALLFVASGVQFWILTWLRKKYACPDGAENVDTTICYPFETILSHFIVVMLSSPIVGVILGSLLFDLKCVGGYKSRRGRFNSLCLVGFFSCICSVFCILTVHIDSYAFIVVSTWIFLFFGGGMLAPLTGITLQSVPIHARSLGASLSQLVLNLFGISLSNLLPGLVVGNVGEKDAESADQRNLRNGMVLIMYWSLWGLVLVIFAIFFQYRRMADERDKTWKKLAFQPFQK
jgi:hypothetical protein